MKTEPPRHIRLAALSLLAIAISVLVAFPALAQTAGAPPSIPVLSVPLATIALLGLVSAYVAQGATTGSVLGLFTISPKAIPYLSTVGTFLATLVAQLWTAAAANALTGVVVFNAVVTALYMLVAPATGAAIRMHHDTPKARALASASGGGSPPGGTVTLASSAVAPKLPSSPPPTQTRVRGLRPALGVLLVSAFCLFGTTGCAGASSPVWTSIENTVLADLENNVILSVIETAVVAIDPALAGIAGAVDTAIQNAIAYLESVGAIPVAAVAHTTEVKAQLSKKIALVQGGAK
jgi:hypothetical protein